MKKILFILCLSINIGLTADVFTANEPIKEIKTEHFTFIFPESVSEVAIELASKAEDIYSYAAELLEQPMNLNIPVVITPSTDSLNGYYNPLPRNRIVLYVAPELPNNGFLPSHDTLETLFLHELVHAISLNSRSPFMAFMAALFGDIVSMAYPMAPSNFLEGVTVSLESHKGFGRANSPRHAAMLQQAIIENKFPSFYEACGIESQYPWSKIYIYGGYFSKYLQETYGFEAYAELWKRMGAGELFNDFYFIDGAFKESFGIEVTDAWEDFKQWIMIQTPLITATNPLTSIDRPIIALTKHENYLYFQNEHGIQRFDLNTQTESNILNYRSPIERISISDDGTKLLLSSFETVEASFYRSKTVELDLTNRSMSEVAKDFTLYEAAYFDKGIIAIEKKNYTGDLVYIDQNNTRILLFSGATEAVPSQPIAGNDGYIYFLVSLNGINTLARTAIAIDAVEIFTSNIEIKNIHHISKANNGINFIYDNDFTLMKLGKLRSDNTVTLQRTSLSGGVQQPVGDSLEDLYYVAMYNNGQNLNQFPITNPGMELETAPGFWIPLLDSPELENETATFEQGDFNALPWLFMPGIRLPMLDIDAAKPQVNGAGIFTISGDPAETYLLFSQLIYNWNYHFLSADLNLSINNLPVKIGLGFKDQLLDQTSGTEKLRYTASSINLSYKTITWPNNGLVTANIGGTFAIGSEGIKDPYSWAKKMAASYYGEIGYQDIFKSRHFKNERYGWSISTMYQGILDVSNMNVSPGVQALDLSIYLPVLNFEATGFGAYSFDSNIALGADGAYQNSKKQPAISINRFEEYSDNSASGTWYFAGDYNLGHEFNIDEHFILGTYIESIDLKTGYRNAMVDMNYLDSFYVQTTADIRFAEYGAFDNLGLKAGVEISYALRKPSNEALKLSLLFSPVVAAFER